MSLGAHTVNSIRPSAMTIFFCIEPQDPTSVEVSLFRSVSVLSHIIIVHYNQQVSQLSQRDRAAGWVIVMAKSGRLELGDNICGHYRSMFNHCDVFGQQSNRIRWKTQNKDYYAVQGHSRSSRSPGRYQLKTRMRLPISD